MEPVDQTEYFRNLDKKASEILAKMKPEVDAFPLELYNSFLLGLKWPECKPTLNRLCVHGIFDWLNRAMEPVKCNELAASVEFVDFMYKKWHENWFDWLMNWCWRKRNHVPESLSCWFKYCVFNRSPNGNDLKTR